MEISDIKQYRNQLGNILVIVLSVIIGSAIYKNQAKIAVSLKGQEQEAVQANELLSQISASESTLNLYKNVLGKGEVSVLINEINSIAKEVPVKVLSIKPGDESSLPSYAKQKFEVTVTAQDYHYLGKFISGLENSSEVFIIDDLNESSVSEGGAALQEAGASKEVTARITLSAIFIKG